MKIKRLTATTQSGQFGNYQVAKIVNEENDLFSVAIISLFKSEIDDVADAAGDFLFDGDIAAFRKVLVGREFTYDEESHQLTIQ